MRKKKEKEYKKKYQKLMIVVAILGVIVIAVVCWSVITRNTTKPEVELPSEEPEGYIDCMPPLDESQAALCEKAEKEGWKIAY